MKVSPKTNICPRCGCTNIHLDYCNCLEDDNQAAPAALEPLEVRTIIRRPSRYQQNRAGYELTLSGLVMGEAIRTVRNAEAAVEAFQFDEAHGLVSPDSWDVVHAVHDRARQNLQGKRLKMAAGQTCADRSC